MTERDYHYSRYSRNGQRGSIPGAMADNPNSLPPCGGGSGRGVLVKRTGKFVSAAWALVLVIIGLEAAMVSLGISIGINPTESQPYRLFLILKNRPFGQGDLIAFRFPGSEYYSEGSLFVKEVRGMPGDGLEMRNDHTVWLNGRFLDTVRAIDSKGKAVKPFFFDGLIPEGHYFLYSPAPNSYDSRYYGLIGKERIVGKATPLW